MHLRGLASWLQEFGGGLVWIMSKVLAKMTPTERRIEDGATSKKLNNIVTVTTFTDSVEDILDSRS